jgi:AcrR family transcriptional regulator
VKSQGASPPEGRPSGVRDRILATASKLFYRNGVHAVGVDLIVEKSEIAKTSLYRHFGNKDSLIAAFLEEEDADFWRQWDAIAARHHHDPAGELDAYLDWMDARLRRPGYRGCPQLNVAAELPDPRHPARQAARVHKDKMRERFVSLAKRLGLRKPDDVGAQLVVIFNGAFISAPLSDGDQLAATLRKVVRSLLKAAAA